MPALRVRGTVATVSDASEPTIGDVLTELRALRADHGERLEALSGDVSKQGADLAAVRAEMATRDDLADLRRDVRARLEALRADHGERLDSLSGKVEALRADLETLGRETRGGWAELRELLTDLPAAVVAAVERVIGPLRADVEELKRKVG